MLKKSFLLGLFVLCGLWVIPSLHAQAIPGKGKLFIIGGGNKPPAMIERMAKEANLNSRNYAVVLPMASEMQTATVKYIKEEFSNVGFDNIFPLFFDKSNLTNIEMLDSLRNANLVYISGGDQAVFMSLVEQSPVMTAIFDAYKKGAVIAGTSAGAAMMSEIMITGNQLKDTIYHPTFKTIESQNIETTRGLGLLKNAVIDQHFLIRSRHNRLLTSIVEHPGTIGIGIDESTAILVNGKHAEVIGISQVLTFSKPKSISKSDKGKLGAKNITVSIYLPGQKFKIP